MYKSVIDIRSDVPLSLLSTLSLMADNAFNNRAGKVSNVSNAPYRFVYQGGENEYGCLEVGMLNLKREKLFLDCVSAWNWVDEDPDECCDLLKLLKKER